MSGGGGESGFSLVELMVVSMILIAIFSGSFLVLKKARDSTSPQSSSGPHLYFESFATSRLKLYFSKLLQWTTQVAPFCDGASYFAYAGNRTSAGRELETLGADIRMSLSTLSFDETVKPTASLAGRFDEERDIPWGMMVPFDSRSDLIGGIYYIQPALRSFCGANDAGASNDRTDGDVVAEMCAWVDVCSAQEGNRSANPPNANVNNDIPILAQFLTGDNDTGTLAAPSFRMCFAFVGNLFSRTGDFVANSIDSGSSTGISAIDNPAVLGFAVTTATFIDSSLGTQLTCQDARHEMNRSFVIEADLFTVTNADKSIESKKQGFRKTRKRFVSEKFGVPVPNCNNESRNSPTNGVGTPVCIADPTFFYTCNSLSCTIPDPIITP
jgi:hypothetical protein